MSSQPHRVISEQTKTIFNHSLNFKNNIWVHKGHQITSTYPPPSPPQKRKKEEAKHKQAVTPCFIHNSLKSAMKAEMCTSQTKTIMVYTQNFKFKQTNEKEELIFNTRTHRTQILNQRSVSVFLQLPYVPCKFRNTITITTALSGLPQQLSMSQHHLH